MEEEEGRREELVVVVLLHNAAPEHMKLSRACVRRRMHATKG
jgi:hypothetical protein